MTTEEQQLLRQTAENLSLNDMSEEDMLDLYQILRREPTYCEENLRIVKEYYSLVTHYRLRKFRHCGQSFLNVFLSNVSFLTFKR